MPAPRDSNWTSKLTPPAGPLHVVLPYADDDHLVDLVARYVGTGLVQGDAVLLFATPSHRRAVLERLAEVGFHLVVARTKHLLHVHDAAATLNQILVGGVPDRERFRAVIGEKLSHAAGTPPRRVRVFGEMLDLRWRAGDVSGALRLEEFWNDLQRSRPADLLLAYARGREYREAQPLRA